MLRKKKIIEPDPIPKEVIPEKPYEVRKWNNALDVFHCKICGLDLNEEDDMILHAAKHMPLQEQEAALETLLDTKEKEIENGSNSVDSAGN